MRRPASAIFASATLILLMAGTYAAVCEASPRVAPTSIRLADAPEQGAFNIGDARAALTRVPDSAAGADLLRLDFTVPSGTAAGVWAKVSPDMVSAEVAEIATMRFQADSPGATELAAALEIKGSQGLQRIPFVLSPGWNSLQVPLNWPTIGSLNEAVVTVNRVGEGKPVVGALSFDLAFGRLPFLEKLLAAPPARWALVFLLGLIAACVAGLPARLPRQSVAPRQIVRAVSARVTGLAEFKRDAVLGSSAVFIVALGLTIHYLGRQGGADLPAVLALAARAPSSANG